MCGNFGLLYLHNSKNDNNNNDNNNNNNSKNNNINNINKSNDNNDTGTNTNNHVDDLMMNSSYNGNNDIQHLTNEDIVINIFEGNNNSINYIITKNIILKEPLLILQHQAANTEIRGGQAGGYSSFEYTACHNSILGQSNFIASISQHSKHNQYESYRDNKSIQFDNFNNNNHNDNIDYDDVDDVGDVDFDRADNNDKVTLYQAEYNQIPDITRIRTVARKRVPLAGDLTDKYLQTRKGRRMAFDKTFTGVVAGYHDVFYK